MVVDRNDKYLTSVDKPVLAQVVPHFEDGKLCLNAPGMDTLRIPIQLDTKEFKDLKYKTLPLLYNILAEVHISWMMVMVMMMMMTNVIIIISIIILSSLNYDPECIIHG